MTLKLNGVTIDWRVIERAAIAGPGSTSWDQSPEWVRRIARAVRSLDAPSDQPRVKVYIEPVNGDVTAYLDGEPVTVRVFRTDEDEETGEVSEA